MIKRQFVFLPAPTEFLTAVSHHGIDCTEREKSLPLQTDSERCRVDYRTAFVGAVEPDQVIVLSETTLFIGHTHMDQK